MAEENKFDSVQKEEQPAILKFCPICGDTMHQEDYLGSKWWFCDDVECGFFEPV
ncbi:hypothetical protein LGA37_003170 [Citrobacter freundii]|uniref:hypothetical protein n=1 Tax=Citrobacter freundii TaxID=546 RepID=UPI001B83A38E|nr:hypothetical protein [Citrobacter freundii]EKV0154244.1 hypothetical protein [Citrobacter freundii]MDE9643431.1 hypothetical protein [Citrobacter freundii]MDE9697737.1 hypothetical protein [Citrobacter freundii]HBC2001485.1 hypothetical protein [Citrobacter freundii]HBM8406665.1 hypothetical protein [Citrobacter freundii]